MNDQKQDVRSHRLIPVTPLITIAHGLAYSANAHILAVMHQPVLEVPYRLFLPGWAVLVIAAVAWVLAR